MGAAGSYLTWDGSKWVMSNNILGVTDGSDAEPGYVGECIEAFTYPDFLPLTIYTDVNSIIWFVMTSAVIPAGDWDISGEIYVSVSRPTTSPVVVALGSLSTNPTTPDVGYGLYSPLQNTFETTGGAIAAHRFNRTAPFTIYALAAVWSPDPVDVEVPTTGGGMLHARRMR